MILIFDTNAIRMLNPEGSTADIIQIIKNSRRAKVAIPEMVLHEMVAQQVIEYKDAYTKAEEYVRRAHGRHPGETKGFSQLPPDPNLKIVRQEWTRLYKAIFDIIPTSGEMALKALIREANGEKPTKLIEKSGSKKKEGARDAAIWLSIVDYMKQNPRDQVLFVTNNKTDFGDGSTWPPPMDADIQGMEERIRILEDMDAVVSELTEEVPASELNTDSTNALRGLSRTVGIMARKKLRGKPRLNASLLSPFSDDNEFPKSTFYRRWVTTPEAELLNVSKVAGHKIGDNVWFVADVEWLLWGAALQSISHSDIIPISCIWQNKVLMTTSGATRPTILSNRPIVKRLLPEEREKWEPLMDRVYDFIFGITPSGGPGPTQNQIADDDDDLLSHLSQLIIRTEMPTLNEGE